MEWQPIETMPKDGALVLLSYSTGEGPFNWSMATGKHNGVYITTNHDNPISFIPTHWMPLPAPPQ